MIDEITLRIMGRVVGVLYLQENRVMLRTEKLDQRANLSALIRPLLSNPMPYQYSIHETRSGLVVQDQMRVCFVGVNDHRYLYALADRINQARLEFRGAYLSAIVDESTPNLEEVVYG
jgi:hypothetical protein